MAEPQPELRALFCEALDRRTPEAQIAYIDEACRGRPDLRARVEALLRAYDEASGFLQEVPGQPTATIDEPPLSERPGTVIGRYKLLQQIGEGGMGTVYMAEQTEPVQRKVALKLIKSGMDSRQVIARFEAERQALALMDHPHIAKVLDAGTVGEAKGERRGASEGSASELFLPPRPSPLASRPYFVMELVKGVPMTRYCDEHHLTPRQRLELFVPVCQAVQHAHQKGIIHRDLKPSNVLVAEYDDKPVAKVIDFGVAKAAGPRLTERTMFTELGQVVGTLEYMSPEQAKLNALDIDTRSDIYALGVLLYELLTGTTPFEKKRLHQAAFDEMLRIIREEEPSKPSTRLSTTEDLPSIAAKRGLEPKKLSGLLRGELDWIIMKCLEKDRNRRYETANSLARDVQRYLHDEPVTAGPPSAWYRFRKFGRRNKAALTTAMLVSTALVLTVAVLASANVRIKHETIEKDKAIDQAKANEEAADRQRQRAEANYHKARDAVDQMLTRVAQRHLVHVPLMEQVRRELLEEALQFYQGFLQEQSTDPGVRHETGLAYGRLGTIAKMLGRHAQAEATYTRAADLLEKLAADFPSEPLYRHSLAKNLNDLGLLRAATGQPGKAESAYRQALALHERLVEEFPSVADYRQDLAIHLFNLGILLRNTGCFPEAEQASRRALDLREALAAEFPTMPLYRHEAADSFNSLGELLRQANRPQEAEQAYHKALAFQEKLKADFPKNAANRQGLAKTYNNLGLVQAALGQTQKAKQTYEQAIAIQGELAAAFPTMPEYRLDLAGHHHNLGILLQSVGRHQEAEQAYRKALVPLEELAANFPTMSEARSALGGTLNDLANLLRGRSEWVQCHALLTRAISHQQAALKANPRQPTYRLRLRNHYWVLAETLIDQEDHGEASRVVEELPRVFPEVWKEYYRAACLLARCTGLAEKDATLATSERHTSALRYAERGIQLLDEAGRRLGNDLAGCNELAWFLATCPDPQFRNPRRAVELAEKAIKQAPEEGGYWNTLGVARYRAGDWKAAVAALEKSVQLQKGGDGFDWLFLAMARWKLGDKDKARQWYGKAVKWMEQQKPKDKELQRFRAEAAELPGIKEKK